MRAPDAAQAGVLSALHVVDRAIADHHGAGGDNAEARQDVFEGGGVRFAVRHVGGVRALVDQRGQAVAFQKMFVERCGPMSVR